MLSGWPITKTLSLPLGFARVWFIIMSFVFFTTVLATLMPPAAHLKKNSPELVSKFFAIRFVLVIDKTKNWPKYLSLKV
jgi:hypothetical protein